MSSTTPQTRRGGPHDIFPTPFWVTEALLEACPELPGGLWVEPAVGDGAIVRAVEGARPFRQRWVTQDIRPDATSIEGDALVGSALVAHQVGDFLGSPWTYGVPDVIITNPPFALAESFARRCIELAEGHAVVALLMRLGFLESRARQSFHHEYPCDLYPLARRPSFTGNGRTDSAAVGWFVWGPHFGGRLHAPIGLGPAEAEA